MCQELADEPETENVEVEVPYDTLTIESSEAYRDNMKPDFLLMDQEYGCDSKDGECSWLNDKGDTQVTLTITS